MVRYDNVLQAIGRTPLIKLNKITRGCRSTLYVKLESVNPGGSIKDRIGVAMIEAAERQGFLKPGGTIIEATAGNTGVGLAIAAAVKGYNCIFVMPDKMSRDKIDLLKAYGAEVVVTPTSVPADSPDSYNGVADRLSREIPGAYRPNQFANPNNSLAHYSTTGPEIWKDTEGKVEVLVAGMGTGGTISGTGRYLKERNPNVIIVGADPEGSILSGDSPKSYKVEGIGEDFIPKNFNRQVVDEMVRVNDRESFNTTRRLAREEGMLVGGSAGTAVAAALKYAQRLETPKVIVVILPDTGRNYLSKIFSDDWMLQNGYLEERKTPAVTVGSVLARKKVLPPIVKIGTLDFLSQALSLMHEFNISQLPVVENNVVVGSLDEASLMKLLHDGIDMTHEQISTNIGKPLATLDESVEISEAYRVLLSGTSGIVVIKNNTPIGVITRTDLINYWAQDKEPVR